MTTADEPNMNTIASADVPGPTKIQSTIQTVLLIVVSIITVWTLYMVPSWQALGDPGLVCSCLPTRGLNARCLCGRACPRVQRGLAHSEGELRRSPPTIRVYLSWLMGSFICRFPDDCRLSAEWVFPPLIDHLSRDGFSEGQEAIAIALGSG